MANRVEVLTDEAPKPGGPYSQVSESKGLYDLLAKDLKRSSLKMFSDLAILKLV